ncbi:hypothetical protein Vretimale_4216, partial [Volvox reticuliferus]
DGTEADGRQRSPTEGPETSAGGPATLTAAAGEQKLKTEIADAIESELDATLAAVAEAAVAIMFDGNLEPAAKLGIETSDLDLGVCEVEELGTNLIGARLLVSVGRGGARRSGTITDYEPNRPRYKWRLVYDPEVLPVGVNTGANANTPAAATPGPAATPTADGATTAAAATPSAAGDAPAAGRTGAGTTADGAGASGAGGSAEEAADASAGAAATRSAAADGAGGAAAGPATEAAGTAAPYGAVVEGEWGTLSDDRTAWLCHGYRRAILASEGVPVLPPAYITAAAVAAAAIAAAQSPAARKRRPGFIDEQSVASALLTLGKRARREAKAAAAAAREARQAEIAAAGGHVILVQQPSAAGDGAAAVPNGGGGAGAPGAAAPAAAADGCTREEDDVDRVKRVKIEPGTGGEVGVTYIRVPLSKVNSPFGPTSAGGGGDGAGAGAGNGGDGTVNVGPVSPIANPEGVVGLEVEVDRGDGKHRGRVLSYDAKKPRLRWLVRYHDGNQEWGTLADDLSTLRVYGFVRQITWTSRPPAVLPKGSKGGNTRNRSSSIARASPAAPGVGGSAAAGGGNGVAGAQLSGGGAAPVRTSARRLSENGDSDWVGGTGGGYGSGGTDYRYIFRRNGMCRAQITHQGCAIISPYYDTPEAAAAAADFYNYKLRGTAAHLNLGLTAEQRAILDHLTLEQLQSYIKGRGDIHDLSKALLQYAGEAGQRLHQQLQHHQKMIQELQRQQQQLLQQQQQQQGCQPEQQQQQQQGPGQGQGQDGQQQRPPPPPQQQQQLLQQHLQQRLQRHIQLQQQQLLLQRQQQQRPQQQSEQQQQGQQQQQLSGEDPEAGTAAAMAATAAAGYSRAASADPQGAPDMVPPATAPPPPPQLPQVPPPPAPPAEAPAYPEEVQIQVEVKVDDDDIGDEHPATDGVGPWDEVMADIGPL